MGKPKKRTYTAAERAHAAKRAYQLVCEARDCLKIAGSRNALEKARLLRTSVQGAVRNVDRWASVESEKVCVDHWHCDPALAAHKCAEPDRLEPCPTCGERPPDLACPHCGQRDVKGVVADIPGCVERIAIRNGTASPNGMGTNVNYDGMERRRSPAGNLILVCGCGEEYEAPHGFEVD